MKYLSRLIIVFLLSGFVSCRKEESLPNIVLIVADDLGWMDVGFMGSSYYETPNLDRLAGEGMVFGQAYAGAANCAPSRACLLTGKYSTSHGIYTVGSSERGDSRFRRIIPTKNNTILPSESITVAEALKEAPDGECLTDRLTEESLEFIRQNSHQPFFLYLPYYAVHTPLQAKDSLRLKYLEKGSSGCQSNAVYAGMVENLDRCIGRVIDELDRLGIQKNTLLIFTSDNGGIREISCQDPLRAGKGSYYEGGIRIPLIISWPGKIANGTWEEDPVINLDIYPTLVETIAKESSEDLDGLSLWPLLSGKGKLHYYYEDGGVELYNLSTDPGERMNLVAVHPGQKDELLSQLKRWLEEEQISVDFAPNPEFDEAVLKEAEAAYK